MAPLAARAKAARQSGNRTPTAVGVMLVRVFTLGFDPVTERFQDEPVRDFVSDKDVVSISDHFFVRDAAPYLALVVCYRPSASVPHTTGKGLPGGTARKRDESWRDELDKADWPLFNRLRDWRGERPRSSRAGTAP